MRTSLLRIRPSVEPKCAACVRNAGALLVVLVLTQACATGGRIDAVSLATKAWEKREAIAETGQALRKGFADLTDEEEYYIGRAVAAAILRDYRPVNDPRRLIYINSVGQMLARYSARPEIYGGYRFMLVVSDEVNAFAAPGGYVFVTTGLYRRLRTEEQLAAVLAHEIAHVTLKHGLAAIKSSNLTQAFAIIGTEAAKEYAPAQIAQLTQAFDGSIKDVVNKLVVSGYSRSQEYDADAEAVALAYRAGYDPGGMSQFLETLATGAAANTGAGFYRSHPPAVDRLAKVRDVIEQRSLKGSEELLRTQRFQRHAAVR